VKASSYFSLLLCSGFFRPTPAHRDVRRGGCINDSRARESALFTPVHANDMILYIISGICQQISHTAANHK
jgi:hypothetical protein